MAKTPYFFYIKVKDLIDGGYLPKEFENPKYALEEIEFYGDEVARYLSDEWKGTPIAFEFNIQEEQEDLIYIDMDRWEDNEEEEVEEEIGV